MDLWEYKKDLDYEDLIVIKHSDEENSSLKSAAATLTFNIDKGIEHRATEKTHRAKEKGMLRRLSIKCIGGKAENTYW